jgi:hypothetical protein
MGARVATGSNGAGHNLIESKDECNEFHTGRKITSKKGVNIMVGETIWVKKNRHYETRMTVAEHPTHPSAAPHPTYRSSIRTPPSLQVLTDVKNLKYNQIR